MIDLFDGNLLGLLLLGREYLSESLVVVRIRMRDHHREGRRGDRRVLQVEAPPEETEHIVGFTRVDQEMPVVRGDDVAAVSLAHVDEIHLERPFFLDFRFLDDAAAPAAADTDVLYTLDDDSAVIAVLFHIGNDTVAKDQFFCEGQFLLPRFFIGLDLLELNGGIDRIPLG